MVVPTGELTLSWGIRKGFRKPRASEQGFVVWKGRGPICRREREQRCNNRKTWSMQEKQRRACRGFWGAEARQWHSSEPLWVAIQREQYPAEMTRSSALLSSRMPVQLSSKPWPPA